MTQRISDGSLNLSVADLADLGLWYADLLEDAPRKARQILAQARWYAMKRTGCSENEASEALPFLSNDADPSCAVGRCIDHYLYLYRRYALDAENNKHPDELLTPAP